MDKKLFCLFAGFSLLAFSLTLLVLYPLLAAGLVVSPDSVSYLNSAANLVRGYGVSIGCHPRNSPTAHWPPGYIFALAFPLICGMEGIAAAQLINLFCYFLLLVGVGIFVLRVTGSGTLALVSQLAVGLHPLILKNSGNMLSEPLSWLFVLLIGIFLFGLVRNPGKRFALGLGIALGCAIMTRYAFVGFLPVIFLPLLLPAKKVSPARALGFTGTAGLAAGAIICPWILRNLMIRKSLLSAPGGGVGPEALLPGMKISSMNWWHIIAGRGQPPMPWAALILLPLAALGILAFVRYRRFRGERCSPAFPQQTDVVYLTGFLMATGYITTLVLINAFIMPEIHLDSRKFSPLVIVFTIMLAALAIKDGSRPAGKIIGSRYTILYLIWAAWIVFQGVGGLAELRNRPLGYLDWGSSPAMAFARERFQAREMLTTDWEPFWLWHKVCPKNLPRQSDEPVKVTRLKAKGIKVLIWFKRTHRDYLIQPADITWDNGFRKMEFDDGFVYILSP